MGEIFAELLRELLAEPARRPADAAGISPASRRAVLGPLAGRAHDDGPFRAVAHLIEDRVDRHPERPAYTFGGRTLSYRRFDQLANGLAAELAARGAGPGDVVPVLLVNGLEMPVAYQALMKLGAAFVPLDPGWPPERIATTLAVLDPQTVVCRDAAALPQPYRARALAVDVDRLAGRAERPAVALRPDGVVYGIFTSGTTGRPKCALNVQAGLANRFLFMTRYFGATGDEVVLQNSKHTFDSSVWQLFWPLTTGARTVIPAQGEFLDLDHTIETIAAHGITMTDFVPSIFNMMVSIVERDPAALRKVASLRQLIVGGEEMNRQAVAALQALLPVRVTNGYGPTETSIGMVFHTVAPDDGDTIPLGRPIDNCYAVIVDDERHPLPQGAVGEIAIGGVCLGRGYFGDPQRTAELFVANPFAEIPGPRLYRTGDLGYFDQRGLLYFLGRTDFQVKIGGVRIELGELEVAAESCPHVRTAKVLVAQRGADKTLAVFAAGDDELSENALRAHLRAVLPRTSLPRHYFVLAELPLTDNGKVDRRALQALLDRALAEQAGAIEADGSRDARAGPRAAHLSRGAAQPGAGRRRELPGCRRRIDPGAGRGAAAGRRVRRAAGRARTLRPPQRRRHVPADRAQALRPGGRGRGRRGGDGTRRARAGRSRAALRAARRPARDGAGDRRDRLRRQPDRLRAAGRHAAAGGLPLPRARTTARRCGGWSRRCASAGCGAPRSPAG